MGLVKFGHFSIWGMVNSDRISAAIDRFIVDDGHWANKEERPYVYIPT